MRETKTWSRPLKGFPLVGKQLHTHSVDIWVCTQHVKAWGHHGGLPRGDA